MDLCRNQVCKCLSSSSSTFPHTDIDPDFKKELANLIPLLLAPENLVEKEIGGSKVTCRDLVQYFKVNTFLLQNERDFICLNKSFGCVSLNSAVWL